MITVGISAGQLGSDPSPQCTRVRLCVGRHDRDAGARRKRSDIDAWSDFYEGPDDVHVIGRNASKTKPAKFVVFLVKEKGAPVLVPAE